MYGHLTSGMLLRLFVCPARGAVSQRLRQKAKCAAIYQRPGFQNLSSLTTSGKKPKGLLEMRKELCSLGRVHFTSQTVDPLEMKKFQAWSAKWWDEEGVYSALHAMNDIRVPFVRDILMSKLYNHDVGRPLAGVTLLDVGCGGGILSEVPVSSGQVCQIHKYIPGDLICCSVIAVFSLHFPKPLGRLGASVTGIDPLEENIKTAELHKSYDPSLDHVIQYRSCALEDLVEENGECFDAVVASEVLEHVTDKEAFIQNCFHLLKPGGSLIITTLNKTRISYALGIVLAEKIMSIVPEGTHDWEKFISPEELERILESNGYVVEALRGMLYNPLSGSWRWIEDTSINYTIHAIKTVAQEQPEDISLDDLQEKPQAAQASV
uniref:Ubiquinone biosynthesis O-methyltransferase, mitochondrial n=1 Tax=Leptobrachium leishanense TaxID=445787 RepID=A0A8C5R0P8_9ANUR